MKRPRIRSSGGRSLQALFLLASLTAIPGPVAGQNPPDTVPPLPDTSAVQVDSLVPQQTPADSVAAQDTLPALLLPSLSRPLPAGWGTGVWEWDRAALLGSRAHTLAELVGEVPGMVLLRGGDYGMPTTVSAFGAGGDRVRVFRDGVEFLPLEGSTPDLTRVGLAGVRSVRVVRSVGEVRIEVDRMLTNGGRPFSMVEAGTGDLNTNEFRGTFAHPRALGGSLAFAMDRVDTRGPAGQEPGAGTGVWLRYGIGLGSRGSVLVDFARASSNRGDLYEPESAARTDWGLRSRWTLLPGLVGDLFFTSASLRTDSAAAFDFGLEARRRYGALLSLDSERIKALGRIQRGTGVGLPRTGAFLEATAGGKIGGVAGEVEWEDWGDDTAFRHRLRGWTAPLFGLSFFAERGSGSWGLPYLRNRPWPPPGSSSGEEEPPQTDTVPQAIPGPRFADHEGTRFGARFAWRGLSLSGARVSVTSDSLFLAGLPMDRAGEVQVGGTRKGFEVAGVLPLYPDGFFLAGSYQWWDQAEDVFGQTPDSLAQGGDLPGPPLPEGEMPWRYLPRRSYEGSLSFHDTFLPTGNLEVWFDLGVKGRDPMVVPFPEEVESVAGPVTVPTMVPFYQSWFVRLQVRVVTVRAFVMWENFTIRQRNQDFPGRILPNSRSLYGVRWTMWN